MIKTMQKKKKMMYILGTNTAVGGLNVERLTTVRNITGGCRMEKKNLCAKNETSLWENTLGVCAVSCVTFLSPGSDIYILSSTGMICIT